MPSFISNHLQHSATKSLLCDIIRIYTISDGEHSYSLWQAELVLQSEAGEWPLDIQEHPAQGD